MGSAPILTGGAKLKLTPTTYTVPRMRNRSDFSTVKARVDHLHAYRMCLMLLFTSSNLLVAGYTGKHMQRKFLSCDFGSLAKFHVHTPAQLHSNASRSNSCIPTYTTTQLETCARQGRRYPNPLIRVPKAHLRSICPDCYETCAVAEPLKDHYTSVGYMCKKAGPIGCSGATIRRFKETVHT